jgi:hypothetical protein
LSNNRLTQGAIEWLPKYDEDYSIMEFHNEAQSPIVAKENRIPSAPTSMKNSSDAQPKPPVAKTMLPRI